MIIADRAGGNGEVAAVHLDAAAVAAAAIGGDRAVIDVERAGVGAAADS